MAKKALKWQKGSKMAKTTPKKTAIKTLEVQIKGHLEPF